MSSSLAAPGEFRHHHHTGIGGVLGRNIFLGDQVHAVMPRRRYPAKNSISKMLVGLAVGGYSYDPTTRSNVPKEIAEDLTKLGLSVGDDTVRKILNDAVDDVGYLVKLK